MNAAASFRQRMLAGNKLVGTFLKTPTSHATEILGDLGYDFVVIDQEHAPFDRTTSDIALMAARAQGTPALVRVPGPDSILSVLDCGATGVLVPHVKSAAYAREVAAMCRYRNGGRGFATSTRAGRYTGVPMWRHIADADASTIFVAQIEDPVALDEIDAIAAVDGVDSLVHRTGRSDRGFRRRNQGSAGRASGGRADFGSRPQGQQADQCLRRERDRGRLARNAGRQRVRSLVGPGLPAPSRRSRAQRGAREGQGSAVLTHAIRKS